MRAGLYHSYLLHASRTGAYSKLSNSGALQYMPRFLDEKALAIRMRLCYPGTSTARYQDFTHTRHFLLVRGCLPTNIRNYSGRDPTARLP